MAISCFFTQVEAQSSIAYVTKGNGQPLIFLPALGCKASIWDNTVNKLSKHYACYEISIKGFGGVPLEGYFSLQRISNDIIHLIKQKKLKNPILIGHSISGFIALKTASENPGTFAKLIVVDALPFSLASVYPKATETQAKQQGLIIKNMILKETGEQFKESEEKSLKNLVSNQDSAKMILNWMLKSDRKAIAEATDEGISTDLRKAIQNIKCKTLIIGTWKGKEQLGFTQTTARKIFEEQYKNLKNKKIVISDNSKHFVMLDNPKWLNKQIKSFITE